MTTNKITKKEKVLNLLSDEELTSPEISTRLDMNSEIVMVYLNRLLKEGKVKRITDKKPYKYKKTMTILEKYEFLKSLFENDKVEIYKSKLTNEELSKLDEI